jgi:hypothetical protein
MVVMRTSRRIFFTMYSRVNPYPPSAWMAASAAAMPASEARYLAIAPSVLRNFSPSSSRAETSIRPSRGVNLTALESRLNTTWRTRRSSALIVISSGSLIRVSSIPPRLARSECIETALRRISGIATRECSSSIRPASILARSSTSLISESRCLPASRTSST